MLKQQKLNKILAIDDDDFGQLSKQKSRPSTQIDFTAKRHYMFNKATEEDGILRSRNDASNSLPNRLLTQMKLEREEHY
jgi:hypothetical protein